jgi:hypothetical protein
VCSITALGLERAAEAAGHRVVVGMAEAAEQELRKEVDPVEVDTWQVADSNLEEANPTELESAAAASPRPKPTLRQKRREPNGRKQAGKPPRG